VTRDELMTHVWEDSGASYSNIIDVYASRLRRKIDEGERTALFSTVRGVGFLLDGGGSTVTNERPARRRAARRRE
jgi:DNA-binding response OmpR family regulator